MLFRWFVGLSLDDEIWDATVFSKNRDRLLEGDIAKAVFERVLCHARAQHLLSDEHFTVDGILIEAWGGKRVSRKKAANRAILLTTQGIRPLISKGERDRIRRMNRRRFRMQDCTRKLKVRNRNCATWDAC
jgi:hypothetical protein